MNLLNLHTARSSWLVLRAVGLASLVTVLFCQCKSNQTYKDIEYSSEKLATPYGHGLTKSDYPFDDGGNYRKDWVKSKTSGRTKTSYPAPKVESEPGSSATLASASETATAVGAGDYASANPYGGPADDAVASGSGVPSYEAPASYTVASSSDGGGVSPVSAPSTTYHKVASGDTLYGISRKYGTNVDELKRVNGLTSSSIMKGQSLRIP